MHVNGNLTAQRYCDEILQQYVVPIMQNNGRMFQHDNARPQTAQITTAYLQNNNIPALSWPSKSPNFNAIKHLWNQLDRRVRKTATLQAE